MFNKVRVHVRFLSHWFDSGNLVDVYDVDNEEPIGDIDLFPDDLNAEGITVDMIEKWWCLGDTRNRGAVYIQGRQVN